MMGPSTSTEVDMFTYEGVNIYSYTLTKIPLQQPKIDKKKAPVFSWGGIGLTLSGRLSWSGHENSPERGCD